MTPHKVATVASPIYSFSLTNKDTSMKRLVKPPRIRYARCGLLIDSCSHAGMVKGIYKMLGSGERVIADKFLVSVGISRADANIIRLSHGTRMSRSGQHTVSQGVWTAPASR